MHFIRIIIAAFVHFIRIRDKENLSFIRISARKFVYLCCAYIKALVSA